MPVPSKLVLPVLMKPSWGSLYGFLPLSLPSAVIRPLSQSDETAATNTTLGGFLDPLSLRCSRLRPIRLYSIHPLVKSHPCLTGMSPSERRTTLWMTL